MINFIINLFESDKQALALYIQAFATIAIGLLAWTATRGQNIIAEKSARKELFKLRYQNIYQEANQLFLDCIELVNAYDIARDIKAKKNKEYRLVEIKNKYFQITKSFTDKMEANKYLIKLKDFDKLNSFCDKYISHVRDYIDGKCEDKMCRNHDVVTCFNEHYEVIPQILSSYLYHENESKLSFGIYKIEKYLKNHWYLFLRDYFPSFCEILIDILLILMVILGCLYSILELLKELLKALISIKNGKIHFELKMNSPCFKRNRPWPL